MTPETRCVLTFRGHPLAISEHRQSLDEFVAGRYTPEQQKHMEITEMVPVLP